MEQNSGDKIEKASIGEEWPPKSRIFGGTLDKQKSEILTQNQLSPISTKFTSIDRI
jgi:hypothetical protein